MDQAKTSSGERFAEALHTTLRSFPISCLPLTLASDIAYAQTANLLWLHFSEWLLVAAIAGGSLALMATIIDRLIRGVRPPWPTIVLGVVVLALTLTNNLVHTRDGWTAVVPQGLALSATSVAALLLTAWFGRKGYHYAR